MSYRSDAQDRVVLEFVTNFHAENGYAPTVREVCEALGVSSTSTGQNRLQRLIREGALRHAPGVVRSLSVTQRGAEMVLQGGTAELT